MNIAFISVTMATNVSNIPKLSHCIDGNSSEQSVVIELGLLIGAVILSIILSATGAALNRRHQRRSRRHQHHVVDDAGEEATSPL